MDDHHHRHVDINDSIDLSKLSEKDRWRLVYKWFLLIYKLSYFTGILGYMVVMLTLLGLNLLFLIKPQTAMDFGLLCLFYGLYFGVVGRDFAEVCTDSMAAHIGYYTETGLPGKRLDPNVCCVCGNQILCMNNEDAIIEETFKLDCNHVLNSLQRDIARAVGDLLSDDEAKNFWKLLKIFKMKSKITKASKVLLEDRIHLRHVFLMGIRHSYPVHRPKEGYREDRNSDSSLANAKVSMWCCCKPRSKNKKSESVDQDSGVTSSKYRKFSSDIENHGVDGNFQHELNSLKSELDKCRIELKECQEQKESLLLRLSELMGKRLQENNPQIANLNDPNRPQKLAEMLDNIYNNEWTDAFMNLTTQLSNEKEREAIEILFDLLKITYDGCLKHVHKLYEHVQDWCKENEIECEKSRILDFVVSIAFPMQYVIETQINKVVVEKYSEHVATICKDYLQRCVIICFYMAVKSPEVYLQFDCPPEQIDKSSFKTYTNDGEAIDFIVWPPLFLFKGGSLMAKGVAQYREKVLESVSEPS